MKTYLANHRHAILLVMIALFLAGIPFLHPTTDGGVNLLKVLTTGLLLAGLLAIGGRRGTLLVGGVLAIPGVISGWLYDYFQSDAVFNATLCTHIIFLMFTAGAILRNIVAQREVTTDLLLGSLSVYLLIGVTWALVYTLVEGLQADAFRFPDEVLHGMEGREHRLVCINSYLYFSFVSLLTIGYGDITPVTTLGRAASVMEGMVGQFYLVILVSRLVGMQVARLSAPPEAE